MEVILKNRNLQLYFGGQLISLIGTWMQQMALSWLVYKLTDSPLMLGYVVLANQLPSLILTPFAGIIADRTNRKRLVIITQVAAMLQATVLATLVLSGHKELWQLLALSAVSGAITAFDLPGRQTFLVELLDNPEQLASAIGLNSSLNTVTRVIGPFVAGLTVTAAGEGACFMANAVSYIAVITALFFVIPKRRNLDMKKSSSLDQLKEGFFYTINSAPIRVLLVFIACVGLFAMPFATLMPAFAKDVFHGTASTLGYLTGAASLGSVAGALFLTGPKEIDQLCRRLLMGCVLSGFAIIGFGWSTYLPLSLLAVAIAGFGTMIVMAGSNILIQTIVDEDKRGRVMSFVVMAFLGTGPFGGMAAGALANVIGIGNTVIITGIITFLLAIVFGSSILRIHGNVARINFERGIGEAEEELTLAKV